MHMQYSERGQYKKDIPRSILDELNDCDGVNCECSAYGESECCCDANWDSPYEILLRYILRNKMEYDDIVNLIRSVVLYRYPYRGYRDTSDLI